MHLDAKEIGIDKKKTLVKKKKKKQLIYVNTYTTKNCIWLGHELWMFLAVVVHAAWFSPAGFKNL